jgi:hypothetical protein
MTENDATSTDEDDRPPVACTLTEDRAEARAEWMREDLLPAFDGAETHENGVTARFDGADETLAAVARFVREEKECCAFADYTIAVSPPYEETQLTITGPEGTKDLFAEAFVGRLAGEQPLEPPS